MTKREQMSFDVVIVGAGPAGLSAAIKLGQLNQLRDNPLSICVLEKGSEVGANLLSGAVLETSALSELLPDWQASGAPVSVPASDEEFLWLSKKSARSLPVPPPMRNHGNYLISLGNLCRWLAEQAEDLGVDVFPGFPASALIIEDDAVNGVITADQGLDPKGEPGANFEPGMEIRAGVTLLGEGCRGSLSEQAIKRFDLRNDCCPQSYGIGLKELWSIPEANHQLGKITHSIGWPLDNATYGGSFIYHQADNQLAVGFVIGLDYQNTYLNPFAEFQRFKTHPAIRPLFEGGKRIAYGARALNEGGFQSIPKLNFPGGLLIGCSAGFLNVPKIKGIHNAMFSGLFAAEAVAEAFKAGDCSQADYTPRLKASSVWRELKAVRNIRPAFKRGLWAGLLYSAFDNVMLRGCAPWTFKHGADYTCLKLAAECVPIDYPKPDNVVSFDRLSSVFISNTNHRDNEPCHLHLNDPVLAIDVNYALYDSPEQRYCPAGVYEIVKNDQGEVRLQINGQNCLHCKTCDIKDPRQNITWVTPEGGGGPNYPNL